MSVAEAPARSRITHAEFHRLALFLAGYVQEHPKEKFHIRSLHELLLGNTKYELKESTAKSLADTVGLELQRAPSVRRRRRRRICADKPDAVSRYGGSTVRDGRLARALLELTNALEYSFKDPSTTRYLEQLAAVAQEADVQLQLPGLAT